uniref:Uncharacterized protein n=1 Tax=Lepeophtheirus salmonis TaxID=72036 RepID=A0A0K2U9D1_LEPSM
MVSKIVVQSQSHTQHFLKLNSINIKEYWLYFLVEHRAKYNYASLPYVPLPIADIVCR